MLLDDIKRRKQTLKWLLSGLWVRLSVDKYQFPLIKELPTYSAKKLEAAGSWETLVPAYHTAQRHNPENNSWYSPSQLPIKQFVRKEIASICWWILLVWYWFGMTDTTALNSQVHGRRICLCISHMRRYSSDFKQDATIRPCATLTTSLHLVLAHRLKQRHRRSLSSPRPRFNANAVHVNPLQITHLICSYYAVPAWSCRPTHTSHLHDTLNNELIPVIIHRLKTKFFACCPSHPNLLVQQSGIKL